MNLDLPLDLALAWLARHGYLVSQRLDTWHECWLHAGDEGWVGRGETAEAALRDALRQALPTGVARDAFLSAVKGHAPPSAVSATAEAPAPLALGTAPESASAATVDPPSPADAPSQRAESAESTTTTITEGPTAPHAAVVPAGSDAAVAPIAPARPQRSAGRRLPPLSEFAAADELEALLDVIRRGQSEVALWTAKRQRLQVLAWVASARAVSEAGPTSGQPVEILRDIASQLSSFSGRWWPGSVGALQRVTLPIESAHECGLDGEPGTWLELAEAAEGALAELEHAEELAGAGEDGWFDDAACEPRHPDPVSALREARNLLERLTGSLDRKADIVAPSQAARGVAPEDLARQAKTLRWIRRSIDDSVTWGDAMGRLRWLAQRRPEHRGLAQWLDAGFRPAGSWANELGWDPEKRVREQRRRHLLRAAPAPGVRLAAEDLRTWLLGCIDLGAELDLKRLASLVQPHEAAVLAIEAPEFSSERRHRIRLKKLQELLAEPPVDLPARDAVLKESSEDPKVGDLPEAVDVVDPTAAMLEAVLPLTRGKRVLVVSNRADAAQDAMLHETFGFAELDHEIAAPRRLDGLVERLRAGSYDLVISASGFQGHTVDHALKPAADTAGIPYVRANRARKLACIRALHRDLVRVRRGGVRV